MKRRWSRTDAALLIGFCALAALFSLDVYPAEQLPSLPELEPELPRYLNELEPNGIYPWAEYHLKPITVIPDHDTSCATPLFWHIPKSGGTTVKGIYKCMDLTLANRSGRDQSEVLRVFRPWGKTGPFYVNADTTSKEGILRAESLGLVPSGLADIIFTNFPDFASEHLYESSNKGRAMGLFRHPVDRLVSKFYYLQVADWEESYSPNWKGMDLAYWAKTVNTDNDHMVKKLAGKQDVSEEDLKVAIQTIKRRFIVGRMDQMEESIRRFNIVMGIDESENKSKECMDQFFRHDAEKKNTNSHPRVEEGSPAWRMLARTNALDMRLYENILRFFNEQKEIIESYSKSIVVRKD